MNNVVYLAEWKQAAIVKNKIEATSNVVASFLTRIYDDYTIALSDFSIDTQDNDTAFDVATIQYLLQGMAHRSQGEIHPSQIILNTLKKKMLG